MVQQCAVISVCNVGLETKSSEYSTKVASGSAATNTLHLLAWSVDELQRLIEFSRRSSVELKVLSEVLEEDTDFMRANTVHQISELKVVLIDIIRGVYWYHRTVATHVLVVMISSESRSSKPYALPVQCIPYASLKDREVRDILNDVIREMVKLGMKVAGILIVFQLV